MKTRFKCPGCQKEEKTFTRYIDKETGKYLPYQYGKCGRENNCNYFLNPYQDGSIQILNTSNYGVLQNQIIKPFSTISIELFQRSLVDYCNNNFVQYLNNTFGDEVTKQLITKYFIGSSSRWKGSTIFWQVDFNGKIRAGKIMLYDVRTGKRVKEPFNYIQWIHNTEKLKEYVLKQCLFGEHLLKIEKEKPVAVVESEKTAIISSVLFPKYIWLATGSLTNLTKERCKVLLNRDVYLFPDLKAFDKWNLKAKEFGFKIFDFLEKQATEKEKNQGLDLVDYLLNNKK